ncbi:efflux RND transporter periplasmic adaptor subunit [Chitiniphilus purpureus]|uniref:Efflux RND transporter periplasmic adaptor subunit n=1 Tax=Chitiniphilus purpureus TaxID=2981137 RepID=A0ABY6DSW7_9NEIS|nr:efflux RND transporter periplasmic adaptor subunit [Chitiniphilus sp. CD1]UXY14983.1 efflux RND transporter periplasmic adaptor subunit [Chitiniphilus sp. CD1]
MTRTLITALAFALALGGCAKRERDAAPRNPTPKVSIVTAVREDVPITLAAQGNVVAINQVQIRPKISSTVRSVEIREGQDVRAGQLLFTLDAREDETVLTRSAALIRKIEADLALAQQTLDRNRTLAASGFLSPSAVDTTQSQVAALQAELAAARSERATNQVKVSYNRIAAPFAGRAGAINVHPGSLVQPGSADPMVTLAQLDPIQVEFTAPERDLPLLLATQTRGALTARVRLADGSERTGKVVFIDNAVDPDAGTIRLKAEFANADRQLWPGLFARVEIDAGVEQGVVVIPAEAVLSGPERRFVYVLQGDGSVRDQQVEVVRVVDERAVVNRLTPGAVVVREGGQNLRPGMKVAPVRPAGRPARGAGA